MEYVARSSALCFYQNFKNTSSFSVLGEVDTYRGSDSAAIRIHFYKGPPL